MTERPLADRPARQRIETDLGVNLVALAGAGAGKTHELVERMAARACRVDARLDRMAAITFTRKAAGEMRGRFCQRLRQLRETAAGEERQRLDEALGRIDQCFIGTIHAFCGQLLRERPVEAGLDPEFVEVDERDELLLRRRAWDEFVQQCHASGDERLTALEEIGVRAEELHPFFARRCAFGDLPLKDEPALAPDFGAAVAAAEAFVERVAALLPDERPEGEDEFARRFEQARLYWRHVPQRTQREQAVWLRLLSRLGDVVLKRWGDRRADARRVKDELYPPFRDEVLEPVLRQWRQHVYGRVAGFIDAASRHYESRRLAAGELTFQDLLLRATSLLRDHPSVRAYFQRRYRCLFVDEFQDTDPVQAEMLFLLTGENPSETDWRRSSPRPGSLFLVGDDKQSIYRFRRADVEVFRLARDSLVATGGAVEQLSTSFRSLGNLCAWINQAFEPLFGADRPAGRAEGAAAKANGAAERAGRVRANRSVAPGDAGSDGDAGAAGDAGTAGDAGATGAARATGRASEYQATFVPLRAYRPAGSDAHCVRRLSTSRLPRNPRAEIAALEAQRIADFIQAAVQGVTGLNGEGDDALLPPRSRPGDFLILTYTRKHLPVYARALEERGIAYDLSGGGALSEADDVRALVNLLAAVHRPDDPLPLLAYLRGPLCGLDDDALLALRRLGGSFDGRRLAALSGTDPQLARAAARLRQARRWLRESAPSVAMERILDDLGLAPFAVAGELGSSRAGNLIRLLALVRQWEARGDHWGRVVEELQELVTDPEYRVEEMTLESGQADVVRLMNLHQAKGLQAPVVFLADPYDTTVDDRREVEFHVSRAVDRPFLSMSVRRSLGEHATEVMAEPVGWTEDEAEERRFLAAEKVRLLYVAATRARNLLVVSVYEGNRERGAWAPLYPHLEEVPELPSVAPAKESRATEPLPDWQHARSERQARLEAARAASYQLRAVTQEVLAEDARLEGAWGRGRDYGSLVHRLLEWQVIGRLPDDVEALVRRLLEEDGLKEDFLIPACAAVAGFRASSLWAEARVSEERYAEVPFAAPLEAGEVPRGARRGYIDLVYRVTGGWKLVDYKTDEADGPEAVAGLAERYRPQVEAYAAHWEALSGEPVVERGLWLTGRGLWVPLVAS
ncbi:MAG: UvrD-helicase domain-containing protein [Gemmatimonadota bacterium]